MTTIEQNDTVEMLNDEVRDLPVSNEQAEQTKAGVDTFSVNFAAIKYDYKPQKPD